MARKTPLAARLDEVKDRIAKACAKAKREPSEITLIAVTKTAAPEQIREILQLGVGDLGESRVQVLAQRASQVNEFHQRQLKSGNDDTQVPPKLRWHMIGHLQRNKAKQVLPLISLIHSVDSLRLAEELEAARASKPKPSNSRAHANRCVRGKPEAWCCRGGLGPFGRADRFHAAFTAYGSYEHGSADRR